MNNKIPDNMKGMLWTIMFLALFGLIVICGLVGIGLIKLIELLY